MGSPGINMKTFFSIISLGFALIIAFILMAHIILNSQLDYKDNLVFEVSNGQGFNIILQKIKKRVPDFPVRFAKLYLRILKKSENLKIGDYDIPPRQTSYQVLGFLMKGQTLEKTLTFQEGFNIYQIAELIESHKLGSKKIFLKWAMDPLFARELLGFQAVSLEGYIFPDTYKLPQKWSEKEYLRIFTKRFLKVWKEIEQDYKPDMSRHQIVILASLIEKETGAGFERPMISSVFHNRLRRSMKIQSDPTTLYGILVKTGQMKKNITRKDLRTPTPYNTYTIHGLPLGPIANPGKQALIAAIRPKVSEKLYFVSKNDGTHKFSKTYKEHQEAIKKYQLDPKARQGKSWRDLHKK